MPRFSDRQRQRVREALIRQGAALFAARGYRSVTVDDIASAAGVAKGTLYGFFVTKEALFAAALQEEHERFHHQIAARFLAVDVRLKSEVKQALRAVTGEVRTNPLFSMLLQDGSTPSWVVAPREPQQALLEEEATAALLTDLIRRGQAAGVIRPGDPVSLATACTRMLMAFLITGTGSLEDVPASMDLVLDLLIDGLYTVS